MRRGLVTRSSARSPGKKTRQRRGKEGAELWPKFDGDVLAFTDFTKNLAGFVNQQKGKVSNEAIICNIGKWCLSRKLADILGSEWSDGTLGLPDTPEELLHQVYEICRRPELAKPHLIRRIESWADIKPVEEYEEMEVIEKVLNLYTWTEVHQVTDAFLSYDVLQELAEYISEDTLMEMHKVIGDEVTDEQLPERVIKYFKVRKKMLSSCPKGMRLESPIEKVNRVQKARELEAAGRAVSLQIQVDRGAKRAVEAKPEADQPPLKKVNTCHMSCSGELPHKLSDCPRFKAEAVCKRKRLVKKFALCFKCLEAGHEAKDCLHKIAGELNPLLQVRQSDPKASRKVNAGTASSAALASNAAVLVPAQEVKLPDGGTCIVMYDTGSQITLISESCAKQIKARHVGESSLQIIGIGNGKSVPYRIFEISLAGKDGKNLTFRAHSVTELPVQTAPYDLDVIQKVFPKVSTNSISCPVGTISILLGADNAQLMPREVDRQGKMILYNSLFAGDTELIVAGQSSPHSNFVLQARVSNFPQVDFLSAEALGTDLPRRCRACKSCRECQFRTSLLSSRENAEYETIVSNLKYDEKTKTWSTSYPFVIDPSVLRDNYGQALACMRSLEAKLLKQNKLAEYNEAFKEIVERGVFRELSSRDLAEWQGPVNYISTVTAYKSGPHQTTPLRICMNSSMRQPAPVSKSLNDLLMKGPPALADLFTVTLGMREYKFALTKDLSKFYNRVGTDLVAQHTRRVVWRDGDPTATPKIYCTTTVNFGDKPAGCIAIAAVKETADRFGGNSEAAYFLRNRTYVDDVTAGSDSKKELLRISAELEKIVAFGGFLFKETHMTGDPVKDEEPIKVLGLIWDTEKDLFKVDVKLNFSGKRAGARLDPDIDLEAELVDEDIPELITKRIIWRVCQGQYDPLGLLSPYTIQLKLVMRDLCSEDGKVVGWDDPAPKVTVEKFRKVLDGLGELKKVSFPRSIKPANDIKGLPVLLVFGDGSREAYSACAYARWPMSDGTFKCSLIACKSRVTPRQKITIPRIELMGSLLATRLAKKIQDTFRFQFADVCYFTDSSCVLGMLQQDSDSFLEFVGNRVSEIKKNTDISKWSWIPTHCNLSDMGTRSSVVPSDLAAGSDYQVGMPWMSQPVSDWPNRKTFSATPMEERRKDRVGVALLTVDFLNSFCSRFSKLESAVRAFAMVLTAAAKWKGYKRPREPLRKGKYKVLLLPAVLEMSERYLISMAQVSIDPKSLESLLPEVTLVKGLGEEQLAITLVGGRSKIRYRIGYDQDGIPVLPSSHPLSRLYILQAHEVDHGGVNSAVMRSRGKVWVMQGGKTAKSVVENCYKCKLLKKHTLDQKMAPLPADRFGPAPIFSAIAIDLFGPLEYRDMVNKRKTNKSWGVIFVCMATSAIHIELTESYSTDSFLQAFRRFICARGTPSRVISDRGSQLVLAAKEVAGWNFSDIQDWCASRKFIWDLVPTSGQHMNGQAERTIGLVKKVLLGTLENRPCTFSELNTFLQEAALIVNSRPCGIAGRTADVEAGGPVTPLHLMLGRSNVDPPQVSAEEPVPTSRRLQYVQEIRRQFWNKWRSQVYQGMDRSYKWRHDVRDFQKGDVVILKNETNTSATYKLGLVDSAIPSLVDNKVRRVIVKYKNKGEKGYRISERPAGKCVLVVPIENQQYIWMIDEFDHESTENVPNSVEPEPTEPQEPEPTEPLEHEPDRPAVAAESEPVEPHEIQETAAKEGGNTQQKTGMAPVPAEGVGAERRLPAELAEPPPARENAGSTSHSEGVPTPPSRQEPVNWAGRLRDRSSRKRPSRFDN